MNILLISEDDVYAKNLSEKLIFLRNDDKVILSSYKNALSNVLYADIILVHEIEQYHKTINLIKDLRKASDLQILFLTDSKNAELILKAADSGADDFIITSSEDYEFVIRIVNCIKYGAQKRKTNRYTKILEQQKIIDELTGLWNYSYSKQVFENVVDYENIQSGIFMAVSPAKNSKIKFSQEKFADLLKNSVRKLDVIGLGKGLNFYILLPNTDFNGAVSVFNKIKENCNFSLCAGLSKISEKSFDEYEKDTLKALADALTSGEDFRYFDDDKKEETLETWLDAPNKKGYKLFRQMFNKKLEKVIAPVFYRLQKTYEAKLFATEIEQYINDEKCVFNIRNKKGESSLSIVYPGFSKIIISIKHNGLNSPEDKEIQLQLSKITQKELIHLIEDFVKEFKLRD